MGGEDMSLVLPPLQPTQVDAMLPSHQMGSTLPYDNDAYLFNDFYSYNDPLAYPLEPLVDAQASGTPPYLEFPNYPAQWDQSFLESDQPLFTSEERLSAQLERQTPLPRGQSVFPENEQPASPSEEARRRRLSRRSARGRKAGPRPRRRKVSSSSHRVDTSKEDENLAAPLSVLLKEVKNVQDADVEKYVNRGTAQRLSEVVEGKVKRPINAFLLYRKAYQNRIKEFRNWNNHQHVSKLAGLSWKLEKKEFQDQFREWARLDSENHSLAFPDYKFSPKRSLPRRSEPSSRQPEPSSRQSESWPPNLWP